jgi:uncharacterized membrane protein
VRRREGEVIAGLIVLLFVVVGVAIVALLLTWASR